MYKVLLCWRYLLTRYLALACVVSVMLGVATLIVVNSVMSGFSTKLRARLHGLLSDVVVDAVPFDGFADPEVHMAQIHRDPFLNDRIKAMTSTMEIFASIQFRLPNGEMVFRPVHVIGIDPEERTKIGGFAEFLQDAEDRAYPSFEVRGDALKRYQLNNPAIIPAVHLLHIAPDEPPPPEPPTPEEIKPEAVILGHAIASFRKKGITADEPVKDVYVLERGDEVIITTVKGNSRRLEPTIGLFVVTDYFKSEMSEYDGNYVFVSKK